MPTDQRQRLTSLLNAIDDERKRLIVSVKAGHIDTRAAFSALRGLMTAQVALREALVY